jgi:MFS family permease
MKNDPPAFNPEASASAGSAAAIAGIIATVSVFAISQGLSYPLLSILLEQKGVGSTMIGLSAAMTPLGFIVSSFFIPFLSRKLGGSGLALACAVLAAVMLLLIAWTQDVWAWFPLRFLLGVFANPLYVVSETWMITITPPAKRGRIMGIYTSVVSAGFAIGPLTLAVVGTQGWPPFLVGISAFLLCGLILAAVSSRLPKIETDGEHGSVAGFVFRAPLLLFAVFAAAAFEQTLLALFPVYGGSYGSSEQGIALLISFFVAGNIALQIPLGALAERLGSRQVMLGCAVAAVLGGILLPVVYASPLVWPLVFVWGAVSFGIYTMGLVELGDRFSGSLLISGNAAFALVWGFGGIAGPSATGALMDVAGVQGLPLALGVLCGTLALCLAVTLARDGRS